MHSLYLVSRDYRAQRRLDEVRRVVGDESFSTSEPISETNARDGYALWAQTYDDGANPIIALEQSIVWGILG